MNLDPRGVDTNHSSSFPKATYLREVHQFMSYHTTMCSSFPFQYPGLRFSGYEEGAEAFSTPQSILYPTQSTQCCDWFPEPSTSPATSSESTDAMPHPNMANHPRERHCSTYNEDRILDKLPPKICKKESAERPFFMSQALIAANEKILRGWEAFKVFPPYATLGLKEYPDKQVPPGVTELIVLAIWQSPEKRLTIQEIYEAIETRFPQVNLAKKESVRESIRHNLSLKQCFIKMKRPSYEVGRRGMLWTVDPSKMKGNVTHRRLKLVSEATKRSQKSSVRRARRATRGVQNEPTTISSYYNPSTTPYAQEYEIPQSSAYHGVDYVSPGYPDTFPSHEPLFPSIPDPSFHSTQPAFAGFTTTRDCSRISSELKIDNHWLNGYEVQPAYTNHQQHNFYLSRDAFEEVTSSWASEHEPRYYNHDDLR